MAVTKGRPPHSRGLMDVGAELRWVSISCGANRVPSSSCMMSLKQSNVEVTVSPGVDGVHRCGEIRLAYTTFPVALLTFVISLLRIFPTNQDLAFPRDFDLDAQESAHRRSPAERHRPYGSWQYHHTPINRNLTEIKTGLEILKNFREIHPQLWRSSLGPTHLIFQGRKTEKIDNRVQEFLKGPREPSSGPRCIRRFLMARW